MDNIEDTFLRADTAALDVKIFNPPKSVNNFMNDYVTKCQDEHKDTTYICHSYYYNVPIKWLGKRFFDRAAWFKDHKPKYYANNYLGEVTGTGGGIFDNVEVRTITDDEIAAMPYFAHGLDFGFEHPQTFEQSYYDSDNDILYCTAEVYARKCKNSTFSQKIRKYLGVEILCDSARPDAIKELQDWGFNAIGAKKRWGSGKGRDYCWEWMQQTTKIVVDPDRCPHLKHELTTLEHEQLPDGTFSDAYPTLEEDCVMALIYGNNRIIMESRRNNGLYNDDIGAEEDFENDETYEE
jgi:phage terminase large subunit